MGGSSKMDPKPSKVTTFLYFSALIFICILYLILRLNFKETIEFGYDQPILANQVIELIKNFNFLKSYNFVLENPWGYPSWGVTQLLFWIPFLLISRDPITISVLITLFNLLGIIFVYLLGCQFFSKKVAIIASLFLTLNPWSIVFSRIIYQPTPVITLIAISMYISFLILKNPKSRVLFFIPFLWAFIYQVYVHTAAFLLISFGLIVSKFKKISKKYFLGGLVLGIIIFIPYIYYLLDKPNELVGFLRVFNKFEELKRDHPYSFTDIIFEFTRTLGGGGFIWQLGYGYEDFVTHFQIYKFLETVGFYFVILIFIYHILKVFKKSKLQFERITLLLWSISPILFLVLIKTPIALPRYFLLSLPAFGILIGIFVDEIMVYRLKPLIISFVSIIFIGWFVFIHRYYDFIINYDYPNGFLSHYSDIPYSFLKQTFDWIKNDSESKKYNGLEIETPNQASNYYLKYIFDKKKEGEKVGRYKIILSSQKDEIVFPNRQFGPYIVFETNAHN